jgi:hypothetical protein
MANIRTRAAFWLLEAGIASLTWILEALYRALAQLDDMHDRLCMNVFEDIAAEFRRNNLVPEPPPTQPAPVEDSTPILPPEMERELTEYEKNLTEYAAAWRRITASWRGRA